MNKAIMGTAVLVSGLLFCCPKVEANTFPVRYWDPYCLSENDQELLKSVAVLEAGETDVEAIGDVMQVVLNRVYNQDFPKTVEECIFQKGQFVTADKIDDANITPAADEAMQKVIRGEFQYNDALYFESLPGKVWSDIHDYKFSYGGHDFYK